MSITQNGACRSPKSEHAEHFWVARGEKLALVNLKNVASLPQNYMEVAMTTVSTPMVRRRIPENYIFKRIELLYLLHLFSVVLKLGPDLLTFAISAHFCAQNHNFWDTN